MTYQMPSSLAKRSGNNGLRVSVTKPFDPPWKAKVALGSFWAAGGMQQLVVSFWAKAEPPAVPGAPLPAPRIDVLDLDDNYDWLGYWQPCALTTDSWTNCFAPIALTASHRGHALDVSIVLGHTAGTTLIDDILVVQQITPPPAPPAPPPPAPPLTPTILYEDFEKMRKQPWPPPDDANSAPQRDPRAVHAVVLGLDSAPGTAPSPTPSKKSKKDGGTTSAATTGTMWADVPTAAAGHTSGVGARLLVKQAFTPAWRARLDLGTHIVLLGDVNISFWGRAVPAQGKEAAGATLPVSVDVLDTSDGNTWVGVIAKVHLGAEWAHHEARVLLGPERAGHHLSFAVVVGAIAGEYMFDEIRIEQATLPGPLSSGSLQLGFESNEPSDAVTAGLAVADLGGGKMTGTLAHTSGARTGAQCARFAVSS
eukprot:4134228-Prymnesium_polylepis.1